MRSKVLFCFRVAESYNRAYGTMVQVQMLSELEEAMQYKLLSERRPIIAQMWWKRLLVRKIVLLFLSARLTWLLGFGSFIL